ncbi:(Fe-S)-binding protein [Ureibacillus manganicus]|uniref:Glycolate oxidase iron-sulfur subunit n=1 Tax=Ureibacillus manganicus DSM 26584 TaxID=1384049 RepID=A0A0A3I194_9BACL|nr:(Fe-S)-binding protein [Ureibacillus manganicus]KGR78489.1 glycolate oxidase [Ureibacillus manganicus DSM 26584]
MSSNLVMKQSFQKHIDEELLLDCMRCGFCLSSCPTYIHSEQDETQSPRGRIALMKAIRDGKVQWDSSVEESFNLCLGCRACEPACPAGVQYGALIEQTREAIQEVKPQRRLVKTVRNVTFNHLFANKKELNRAVKLVRFYQKSGLQKVTRKIGFLNLFPPFMKDMEKALPDVPKKVEHLKPIKTSTTKVAFFTGCLMDSLFKEINDKTVELIKLLGAEVEVPANQQCCGALHAHSGELQKGIGNAKLNVEAFDSDEYDYIVNNAGGCGAFLSEYEKHLNNNPLYAEKAKRFSSKLIDISSLLVKLGIIDYLKTFPSSESSVVATYQDSCHLRNVNKVFEQPRLILRNLPGLQYEEMTKADSCCGSAGIYNLLQPEMAGKILATKMGYVKEVNPTYIVTSNPGCLMQMKAGISKEGLTSTIQAVHIVELIYEQLKQESKNIKKYEPILH